jgi:hypothetical protein
MTHPLKHGEAELSDLNRLKVLNKSSAYYFLAYLIPLFKRI